MTENVPAISSIPTDHEMTVFNVMAKQAVQSKFYRNIGDESAVMMIMLAARELNLSPVTALNGGIRMINGVMELSARAMNMMIRRAGHSVQVKSLSDTECVLVGRRKDSGDTQTTTYSIADAQKAKLIKEGGGWTKNPKDMLFARALSRLARQLFADVIGNAYTEGEVSDPSASKDVEHYPQLCSGPNVIEYSALSEEEMFIDFMKTKDPKDETDWQLYIKIIMEYWAWTYCETIKYFKSHKALDKDFEAWRKHKNENGKS